ncbi:5-formyltetrahydrofolate cyclo-ligase [Devosia sp. 63-57]|uniref:5-formyltetrahydrofolate cyclo-ligase n=1 Tax=Devosia sp. 63-57 TaxID=1895751 RepID=UPI000868F784|nr:5-formyltetrahydrofolate cyclo-ligase [Devosia sp. 63-57]ODT48795.1 MAG: 5-formyltetrahydrofolate cyclo-ligase [Pelagibacterium sp. SCN 63-126]ODU86916.1 MAG: 5-formyltetrahydrofolate cyclo-ligase [Pelagibacterium sp. SCN 63-17]OJX44277.1 MAG: 5-formyltetrahydrofolate cyclo-ligase [Devosia sp. 63-57]
MADQAIEEAKAGLRKTAHAARATLSADERSAAAEAVAAHFFDKIAYEPEQVIAGYWRIRDELDCQPILVRLMDGGQRVVLPVVDGADKPLDLRVWEADAPLYEAGFGTLAPSDLAPRAVPDIVLMPLLGFDAAGTRLGYGGGYYDRTLAALPRKPLLVGLAFDVQELQDIPREEHDVPLDAVITEAGVRFFGTPS